MPFYFFCFGFSLDVTHYINRIESLCDAILHVLLRVGFCRSMLSQAHAAHVSLQFSEYLVNT